MKARDVGRMLPTLLRTIGRRASGAAAVELLQWLEPAAPQLFDRELASHLAGVQMASGVFQAILRGITRIEAHMAAEEHNSHPEDRLVDAVLNSKDVHNFLNELAHFSVEQLDDEGETLCGVTLLRHNRAATVASSSERGRAMDEIQYSFDDGPCLRASREQETIYVRDLTTEKRWPDYAAEVSRHGMRSILAVPFNLVGDAKAALNLYSGTPDSFSAEAIQTAEAHALRTSRALSLAVKVAQDRENNDDLKAALESRTIIDVAVGILMGQNRCSQDAAFHLLQEASSRRNVKLREVAAAVVASASGSSDLHTHFDS